MSLSGLVAASPASAAPGQAVDSCVLGTDGDYPPEGGEVQIELGLTLVSGSLVPGGAGSLVFSGATPGGEYSGTLFSTPIALGPSVADAGGGLGFAFATPSDFELGAMHHIDLCRGQVQVGAFELCATADGTIVVGVTSCDDGGNEEAGGALPRTGTDHLMDALKVAALLLALGAALVYWRRRREALQATA